MICFRGMWRGTGTHNCKRVYSHGIPSCVGGGVGGASTLGRPSSLQARSVWAVSGAPSRQSLGPKPRASRRVAYWPVRARGVNSGVAAMSVVTEKQLMSVAPMMDWTDLHWRQLARMLSRHTWLWTEMVVDLTLVHQDPNLDKFLWFPEEQHPIVLQLGGSDPETLAKATELALPYGYDEINLNCGCPSDRVAGAGCFGAALMLDPHRVAACCAAMNKVLGDVPLTVKCRLGVDDRDSYEELAHFVRVVSEEGGVTHFIMHARKAYLQGLNPHQNRTIPPLRHQWVFALRRDFPHLSFSLNGGVQSCSEVSAILESTLQGNKVEGIMVGRAAYHYPWQVLAVADTAVFGAAENPAKSRRQVLQEYAKYADSMQGRFTVEGHKQNPNTRSLTIPILNLFHGEAGNRAWKQSIDKVLRDAQSVSELLDRTLHCFSDQVLDAPPSQPPRGMTAAEWLETLQELPLPATGEYDSSVRSVDEDSQGNGYTQESKGNSKLSPSSGTTQLST